MNAVLVGEIIGLFAASIAVPVLLLIVFLLTPLKRRPKVAYGIACSLATLLPFATLKGGAEDPIAPTIAAILSALFFFWGYARAKKKQSVGAI